MKKTELICDYCGESLPQIECALLPKDWYALAYHKGTYCYDDWRVTHHFCSLNCMNKAVKVAAVSKGNEE